MPDSKTPARPSPHQQMTHDGAIKVRPLTEGYLIKGGRNETTSQITKRPPPPAPIPQPKKPTSSDK